MSEKRNIPFGYTVRNGKTVIDPGEAQYIRRIFKDYINGASLKEIAEQLTKDRVPFTVKSCEWGKARVARIIANAIYTGSEEYDPIIEQETFDLALECKRSRLHPTVSVYSHEIDIIRSHIKCERCGHSMMRTIGNNCRIREAWTCRNKDCRITVRIGDYDLIDRISIIMNRIIQNSNLMIPAPKKKQSSAISAKLKEEIQNEMQNPSPSESLILELITKAASEEYKESNSQEAIAARLAKQRIQLMKVQESFNETFFNDIVKTVYLNQNGLIRIITKTDAEIYESGDQQ